MKKVRFVTTQNSPLKMNDSECHSPRPFLERELRPSATDIPHDYPRVLPYNNDPVHRYESSNSSPYPTINRTLLSSLPNREPCWKPSDDLNLSLLDASNHEPRKPVFGRSILKETHFNQMHSGRLMMNVSEDKTKPAVLSSNDSMKLNDPPNVLMKDNSFFIKRDNLDKYHFSMNPLHVNRLTLGKENDPLAKKAQMMITQTDALGLPSNNSNFINPVTASPNISDECRCHHCIKPVRNCQILANKETNMHYHQAQQNIGHNCICSTPRNQICLECEPASSVQNVYKTCGCQSSQTQNPGPKNAVDRKTLAIEKYEQSKQPESMEIEKQTNVSKEKREPTVADLFKIIKLQNEQLQLLQEKVDKFISSSKQSTQDTIKCSTEHLAVNTVENDQHKMSIGVMTSFEMIRTSTVINKEVVKQTNENAQMQCNRSQISIKEVISKPVNMNFLDGIIPKNVPQTHSQIGEPNLNNRLQTDNVCEEKTLNELSLYNVQVDNATTPLMSPEQTLYLDVRDYSDSEASSNDRSNVGWTYYNKVMTHVNGMLQEDMPSSASAMYRNMRQQCVQMQIDKTNVSVTKRVKFGDDPLGVHQPHIYAAPATDTSLKMNQLAAKYLKNVPPAAQRPAVKPTAAPIDMSFATKNYMEKHRLLEGVSSKLPQPADLPRFLDITALKQQPKFL